MKTLIKLFKVWLKNSWDKVGGNVKKIFSSLVFLIAVAGVGYFVSTEYINTQDDHIVAVDTGKITVDEIDDKDFENLDKETKALVEKYPYSESFESFDELNRLKLDDESYEVAKYGDKKLYLIIASKQKDGSVVAVFDENTKK